MKNPKTRIFATNGKKGLDIYLDISGNRYYLASRRNKGLLYTFLKDGKTINELSRVRPQHSQYDQKLHHYAKYLLKLVDNYYKYDLFA